MSSRQWGDKRWSKATKERRLKIARDAMDAIDVKFAEKEAEQYLDPDKRFIDYNVGKHDDGAGGRMDADAIGELAGDYDWLAPGFEAAVGAAGVGGGVVAVDAGAEALSAAGPFRSLEHAFQAVRAGPDATAVAAIRAAKTAREAKSLGAKAFAKRRDGDAFRERSTAVMEVLLRDKFLRHPDLRAKLLATEERRVLHVNDFNDAFWGLRRADRKGRNELGKAVGRVRAELRAAASRDDCGDVVAWCLDRAPGTFDRRDAAIDVAWRRSGSDGLSRLPTFEETKVVVVGRHDHAGLKLDHGSTSRLHAALVNAAPDDDDTAVVVDLGASHGTFVHRRGLREPVKLVPFVFYHLQKKDELRFGESTKRFRVICDRTLRKRKADKLLLKMTEAPDDVEDEEARTVKITSLAYEADEADLRKLFADLDGVKVLIEYESASSRRHRGVGFALLRNQKDVYQALACDGDEVKGRKVRVFRVNAPPPEKKPRRD